MKSLKINAFSAIIVRVLNIIFPLITAPYIARTLSKENIANFDIANTVVQLFIPFATFGIYTYGIRAISQIKNDKNKINNLFSELFYLSILTTIITTIIYILYITNFININNNITHSIYIILGCQIFFQFLYIEWLNEAFENYTFIMYKTIIVRIVMLTLVFTFIKTSNDIIPYALIMTFAELLNFLLSFLWIKKEVKLVRVKFINIIKLLSPLFTILLLSNLNMFYTYLDRLFLSNSPIATYISDYMIANNIVMLIIGIISGAISVTIPRLSYYIGENHTFLYEKLVNQNSRLFLFFVTPISFGIMILGTEMVYIYGGDKFITAGLVASIFGFRTIVWALDNIIGIQILFIKGYEKNLTISIAIGGVVNLILNYSLFKNNLFLPEYYILTTVISEIIVLLSYIYFIKTNNIMKLTHIFKYLVKYSIISSFFIVISYLINILIKYNVEISKAFFLAVSLKILGCSLFYFFILYKLKDENIFEAVDFIKLKLKINNK